MTIEDLFVTDPSVELHSSNFTLLTSPRRQDGDVPGTATNAPLFIVHYSLPIIHYQLSIVSPIFIPQYMGVCTKWRAHDETVDAKTGGDPSVCGVVSGEDG